MTQHLKKNWVLTWVLIWVAIGVAGLPGTAAAGEADGDGWVSKIISLQGTVLVRRHGQTRWQRVKLDDIFYPGDRIRIERNSRAGIVLSNDAVMRLDQNTTLIFNAIEQKKTFVFKLLEGAANFFSHRPRSLKILTPFVNGMVEGTEFFVQVDAAQTRIDLFAGRILAENDHGVLGLAKGERTLATAGKAPKRYLIVRPRESVQWAMYYPPVLFLEAGIPPVTIARSLSLFNNGQPAEALAQLESMAPENRDATFFVSRAAMLLHVGRTQLALSDINQALALDPNNGDALALKAVIAVVQNRAVEALETARLAVERAPRSVSAPIALSYALQARFKLDDALEAARNAVRKAPGSALAWARLADLQLSVGALEKGVSAAQKAVELAPRTAHAQTVLGFAYLTRIKTENARQAFGAAIDLDSAAPLPRLGLGLAKIRDGDLESGRSEIEIAAGLDPANSLIRSYLGKAYFDEKRDPLDGEQFDIAKTLDPNDPTPWFYDAIRKQSLNRPVEALQDLQKSIELNDNRAVFRSRLQLDQDLASRAASLGRIYNDLGFQELALRQGWSALNSDPANYSAHKLLADSYRARFRHEIARVSELLQAQLLQPLSLNPVQPQISEANLLIPEASGAGSTSLYEFNPLFTRNRLAFQGTGIIGNNETWGDEIALSGIYNQISCGAGQFHYETNGFRENNDLDQDIYSANLQMALTPKLNFQAEYRSRKVEHGDLAFTWDLDDLDSSFRRKVENDIFRIGAHFKPATHSDLIASFIYQDKEEDQSYVLSDDSLGFIIEIPLEIRLQTNGYIGEVQYLYGSSGFDVLSGGGYYEIDLTQVDLGGENVGETKHANGYLYTYFKYPKNLNWTVGFSYDSLDHQTLGDFEQINPKLGVNMSVAEHTNFRLAAFRVLKRTLIANQTLEPTNVSGFNQFYDDYNGTDAVLYGAGIDHRFSNRVHGGFEYYSRQLETPVDSGPLKPNQEDWDEDTFRVYAYWAICPELALSTEYTYENFDNEVNLSETVPLETTTHMVPVRMKLFLPSGFFCGLMATYVNQEAVLADQPNEAEKDEFEIFDFTVGYRLPKRYGMLGFEIRNLFDKSFNFLSIDSRTSQFVYDVPFLPERTFLFHLTVSF